MLLEATTPTVVAGCVSSTRSFGGSAVVVGASRGSFSACESARVVLAPGGVLTGLVATGVRFVAGASRDSAESHASVATQSSRLTVCTSDVTRIPIRP